VLSEGGVTTLILFIVVEKMQSGELPWLRFFAGTFRCVEFLRENTFCDPLIVVRAIVETCFQRSRIGGEEGGSCE
jgi:hypothetical protein